MEFAKELRSVCDEFGEKILLGEVSGDRKTIRKFSGDKKNDGLGLVFNFEMLRFKFSAKYFHELVSNMEKDFPEPFMPVYVFSNHDRRRSMMRLKNDVRKAKLLHLFQLTVRGVPCMYYGEEIGMTDARIPFKKGLDPIAQKMKSVPRFLFDLAGETPNRDELRTPMQWNNSKNAGFSSADKTWLPLNKDFSSVNVETEMKDENSLLKTVQQILKVRDENSPLNVGTLQLFNKNELPENVLGYVRTAGSQRVIVLINFSKNRKEISLHEDGFKILFNTSSNGKINRREVHLAAFGGIILSKSAGMD